MTIEVDGIYASEWKKFHPEQFVSVWQFQDSIRLNFYGTADISQIPEYLADEDLDDFVLQPTDDEGNQIPLKEAIELGKKYVGG